MVHKKKVKRKQKIDPTSKTNLFSKAVGSATAGLPISYILNIIALIPLVIIMGSHGYPEWSIALVVAIPFFWASVFRMFLIDYMWVKHNINVDPKHLMKRLYDRFVNIFVIFVEDNGNGKNHTSGHKKT